jgi:phosphatidylglycerophosphate synthase
VLVVLLAFTGEGVLTALQLLVMLVRDLFVSIGVLVLVALRRASAVKLQARFPGKLVTTLQIAAVLLLTVMPRAATVLVIVTAVASIWAIGDYGATGLRALRAAPQPR